MPTVNVNGGVQYTQSGTYGAVDDREAVSESVGPGCFGYNDFLVAPSAGMILSIQPGIAYVRQPVDGTLYRITQDNTALALTLTAANGTNPRLDQVILRMYDAVTDGSSQTKPTVETIDGTPTSGATLDNRSGAADPQTALVNAKAYIPLADILVPAGASSITGANIRIRKPYGQRGAFPQLGLITARDAVTFEPCAGLPRAIMNFLGSDHANKQSAAAMFLPRRIPATAIRWRYHQDNTTVVPNTVNWNLAIYDASGTRLAFTGATAFSGAVSSSPAIVTSLTVPYAGYVFDAGWYYVWFGLSAGWSSANFWASAVVVGTSTSGGQGRVPMADNMFLSVDTGGASSPVNLLGMTDSQISLAHPGVPVPTLVV